MKMDMNNTELAILGLISAGPRHGYQLEQEIVQYGMREWTEIGFSSIYYVLNRMEAAGWLSSEMHTEGDRPARKIYQLTTAGRAALHDAVQARLTNPRPRTADFDLALSNLLALSPAEIHTALQTYRDALAQQLVQVQAKWERDAAGGIPPHVHALFDHGVAMLRATLEWVEKWMLKLNNLDQENK